MIKKIETRNQLPETRKNELSSFSGIWLLVSGIWFLLFQPPPSASQDDYRDERLEMVQTQIEARGVSDPRVLTAMRKVPRHEFVPAPLRAAAYGDSPLPIGEGQTISQPYIVALMTEALGLKGREKVLEIGTGSGYQAAILAELSKEVYTIEIIPALAKRAEAALKRLGYKNITVKAGDGYQGWPEHAPFDAIIVTAAPGHIPEPLKEQLAEGARMVIPLGDNYPQRLMLLEKKNGRVEESYMTGVMFVPMTGEASKN